MSNKKLNAIGTYAAACAILRQYSAPPYHPPHRRLHAEDDSDRGRKSGRLGATRRGPRHPIDPPARGAAIHVRKLAEKAPSDRGSFSSWEDPAQQRWVAKPETIEQVPSGK